MAAPSEVFFEQLKILVLSSIVVDPMMETLLGPEYAFQGGVTIYHRLACTKPYRLHAYFWAMPYVEHGREDLIDLNKTGGILCVFDGNDIIGDLAWMQRTLIKLFQERGHLPIFNIVVGNDSNLTSEYKKIFFDYGIPRFIHYNTAECEDLLQDLDYWLINTHESTSIPFIDVSLEYTASKRRYDQRGCHCILI